jgi:tetratricopeptide (TPR) repeat protein
MLKRNLTAELVGKFNEALAKIKEYREEGKNEEALNVIDDTLKDLFRLGFKFFDSFADENLIDMVKTDGTINADKCIMMAKLLEEDAEILESLGNSNEAFFIFLKSLNLFLEAFLNKDEDCDLQHFFSDIDAIIEKISDYKVPDILQNKIFDYYTKIQNYDKAENILYEILEDNNFSKNTLDKAISFYEELLTKDDEDLEHGNLSREELVESLNILKKKL